MFPTLKSYTIFFFISLALIILGIVFEHQLIALEKKFDKKRTERYRVKREEFECIIKENNRLKRRTAKLEHQVVDLQKENFCLKYPDMKVNDMPAGWYFYE